VQRVRLGAVSYEYVCEPCRQALGMPAERSYLDKIKREAGGFGGSARAKPPQLARRDPSGKPRLITTQLADVSVTTPAGCTCDCTSSNHDPWQCTGESQFRVGGRPGSGAVDELAKRLGAEPVPEMFPPLFEGIRLRVAAVLAWYLGSSDYERASLEAGLVGGKKIRPTLRYDDQVTWLRDILKDECPDLIATPPYRDFKANLIKLARFRDLIAHSQELGGDFFRRWKIDGDTAEEIRITPEELANYVDLSHAVKSQLWFLPIYINPGLLEPPTGA
jgi:hypothetical protein